MYEQGFAFDQWMITPADSTVSGPYGETHLEPRVMDVLIHLALGNGEVVTRNDLIDAVWGGAVVGDEVLSRCIYQIRRALGESSREPRFIQTVPKRGYRLNAKVVDLGDATGAENTESWSDGSPFRGLEAFDTAHAPVFFGRTRATFEALTALRQQAATGKPFLLLLGASGVGKSSLARAGLLSNLLKSQDASLWHYDVFTPGSSRAGPVHALLESLSRALDQRLENEPDVMTIVAGDADTISTGTTETMARLLGNEERVILVIDQLEEVFATSHIDDKQRHDFFNALERLVCSGLCWIVATLRSDFYPNCANYPALMRLRKGIGQYDVRPLGPTEIQQTIRLPAVAAGLKFEHNSASGRKLDEMIYEAAAAHPNMLPLLEFTLQRLYEARSQDKLLTIDAYERIGGLKGSLARRAEDVFADLPTGQQDSFPLVMSRLVRLRGELAASEPCPLDEVSAQGASELVQAFIDARLFSTELGADGSPSVSVTHETLLSEWPRLRTWIDDNRDRIRVHQRVATACERWFLEAKPDDLLLPRGKSLEEATALLEVPGINLSSREKFYVEQSSRRASRRRRLERAGIAALVVLTIAAGSLAWQALEQRNDALNQRAIAERETAAATETADFLLDIFNSADPSETSGGQLTAKRMLDESIARLDSGLVTQDDLRTRLRALVARAYKGIGLYSEAEELLRRADAEAALHGEISERERLEIRYQIADTLFQQGKLDESEALHAEILARRIELFGDRDLDTVSSQSARAHELWRDGNVHEAETLFQQVLSTRQEQLGKRHSLVTEILTTLGSLYYSRGMMDEATKYHRAAAEQAEETYGERSIGLAIALSNLAHVESDPAESEALFNRSLAIRREVLGPNHILVARAEEILASFYAREGEPERAEPLFRQAIRKIAISDEGPAALGWLQNSFAKFLENENRYEEAIDLYKESRDNFATQLGDGHRWTLVVHGNLALANYLAGDVDTARHIFEDAITAAFSAEVPSERAIADLHRAYTDVLLQSGDLVEAERSIRVAVDYYERDSELNAASLASALGRKAEVLFLAENAPEALVSAKRAQELSFAGANESNAYLQFLIGVLLAPSGDCDGVRAMFAEGSSLISIDARTGPQWMRLEPYVDRARQQCAQ